MGVTHDVKDFGFEAVEEIPVKENDWTMLVRTFMESEAPVIRKEFEDSRKASNAGGAIRKAAEKLGAKVVVTNDGGTLYVSKA